MSVVDRLYEQAKLLPGPLVREALDFVLFLHERQERAKLRGLTQAQVGSLASVWGNEEDEAWNHV